MINLIEVEFKTAEVELVFDIIQNYLDNNFSPDKLFISTFDESFKKRFDFGIKHRHHLDILHKISPKNISKTINDWNTDFKNNLDNLSEDDVIKNNPLFKKESEKICTFHEYEFLISEFLKEKPAYKFLEFEDLCILPKGSFIIMPGMNSFNCNEKLLDYIVSQHNVTMIRCNAEVPPIIWSKYSNIKTINTPKKSLKAIKTSSYNPNKRPYRLSATDISMILNDPYAFYVKKILKLVPKDNSNAKKGNIVHKLCYIGANTSFEMAYEQILNEYEIDPFLKAELFHDVIFLKKEFKNIKDFVVEHELFKKFDDITVIARADLITSDYIIDYKTSSPPTKKSLLNGEKPQLLIEAILSPKKIEKIGIWSLIGKNSKKTEVDLKKLPIDEFLDFLNYYKTMPFEGIAENSYYKHIHR